ncbi:MAG: monofunctional biosynthetic peptidoglycan transglycosylase [Chitinophagaceae bacterium]|nr:monofunctional biosynthetic peptidoglycan transglycosylase [Chitinophagaceae bacterium]
MAKSLAKNTSVFKYLFKLGFRLLLLSIVYLFLCKWIMPPVTITQLVSFAKGEGLNRDYVHWDKIAPSVKLAAIASEDQLFVVHNGFDWQALQKSLSREKTSSKAKGTGASTISQQTAKNIFLWQGSSWAKYVRKVPEFFYTQMIELIWGKKRILEVYLNTIEMGKGVYGIEAAAQLYFHKSAADLSSQEAAMIIACLPNPKRFTVVPKSKRVAWRSPQILKQMDNIRSNAAIKALIWGDVK